MIASFDRHETWSWCYVHRRYVDIPEALLPKRRSALTAIKRFFHR
jgi:hypothetical protein